VGERRGSSEHFLVSWGYPRPKVLAEVIELAQAQLAGFLAALNRLDARLDEAARRAVR
jgi:hypothetical protein